jgi:hypothetical protein
MFKFLAASLERVIRAPLLFRIPLAIVYMKDLIKALGHTGYLSSINLRLSK